MITSKQIPSLIKLLDDESPLVYNKIIKELVSFGLTLQDELRALPFPLNPVQQNRIDNIIGHQKKIWLSQNWQKWVKNLDDTTDYEIFYRQLEEGLSLLSQFLNDWKWKKETRLNILLDQLSDNFKKSYSKRTPRTLAKYLFSDIGLLGNEADYHNPQNSNLAYVIQEKKGIPISLTCIYMLVGWRLGLEIVGCNFPGHFLGRFNYKERRIFVDCFSAGQMIEEHHLIKHNMKKSHDFNNLLKTPADTKTIIKRYFVNLIRIYKGENETEQREYLSKMFNDLDHMIIQKKISELTPDDIILGRQANFKIGQIIRHTRYNYHGLVVDLDQQCHAHDQWYYGNLTQPDRNQHWYHVLVHGSDQVTYVAESNLIADSSIKSIAHPLINHFFSHEKNGRYVRNDNPWPDSAM